MPLFGGADRALLELRRLGSLRLGREPGKLAVTLDGDFAQARDNAASARGYQAADDDVLLEPLQVVDPPRHRRFGQDARGLLE